MPGKALLALAQLNPTVGDIIGNAAKLRVARTQAGEQGADLVITSELFLSGYPPEDLVLKPSFQAALMGEVYKLAAETANGGPAILLGTPWTEGVKLYNASILLSNGSIAGKTYKHDLPNYGPFDEKRVFVAGPLPVPLIFNGLRLGVMICEDMWTPDAAQSLAQAQADLLIVPNGSPFETEKTSDRLRLARARTGETKLPLVYVNQVGGQDELIFDGASFCIDAHGQERTTLMSWSEELSIVDSAAMIAQQPTRPATQSAIGNIYEALMLGLRDYITKNGFPSAVLGLSGGIDSALVAVLAVDALGADRVWTVMMPSPYTSSASHTDASSLARKLKCRYETIAIEDVMGAFQQTLKSTFEKRLPDVTEENIQARCRGIILMALSNKFGPIVLSTGNKSEMSVGYSTLYGDLCGGFAVLKDVYKTDVYKLAEWRNHHRPRGALGPNGRLIDDSIMTKAPTAELRFDQKDQDSLPPYEILDDILRGLIEADKSVLDITAGGHEGDMVRRVWQMLDRSEYKRRQGPPGVKITRRLLGKDRRYPITNRYSEDN